MDKQTVVLDQPQSLTNDLYFKAQSPPSKDQWEQQRLNIKALYLDQGLTLKAVMAGMKERYGFHATSGFLPIFLIPLPKLTVPQVKRCIRLGYQNGVLIRSIKSSRKHEMAVPLAKASMGKHRASTTDPFPELLPTVARVQYLLSTEQMRPDDQSLPRQELSHLAWQQGYRVQKIWKTWMKSSSPLDLTSKDISMLALGLSGPIRKDGRTRNSGKVHEHWTISSSTLEPPLTSLTVSVIVKVGSCSRQLLQPLET